MKVVVVTVVFVASVISYIIGVSGSGSSRGVVVMAVMVMDVCGLVKPVVVACW